MGRRGPRALPAKGKAKPKKSYDLIEAKTEESTKILALIKTVVEKYRPTLERAKIGAAWMINRKPDRDGFLQLGRLKKCSELERQLHGLDAIVVLNQEKWRVLHDDQRIALMHHELCHLEPALDNEGEQAIDGHGKLKWRGRRHDIEEFREVVATHGCYKADIQDFVRDTLSRDPQLTLFKHEKPEEPPADLGSELVTPTGPLVLEVELTEKEMDGVNDVALLLPKIAGNIQIFAEEGKVTIRCGSLECAIEQLQKCCKEQSGDFRMAHGQTLARVYKKLRAAQLPAAESA